MTYQRHPLIVGDAGTAWYKWRKAPETVDLAGTDDAHNNMTRDGSNILGIPYLHCLEQGQHNRLSYNRLYVLSPRHKGSTPV